MENRSESSLYCSFCEKPQDQVSKLVAGRRAYICDVCIELCVSIIEEERPIRDGKWVSLTSAELYRVAEEKKLVGQQLLHKVGGAKVLKRLSLINVLEACMVLFRQGLEELLSADVVKLSSEQSEAQGAFKKAETDLVSLKKRADEMRSNFEKARSRLQEIQCS